MSAALTMVPLDRIKAGVGFNPRSDFDEERMAELVESIRRHGIISPLTLVPDGAGGFTIIAGERRYRAAKAAKLREVPAQVRDDDAARLTLAAAENVTTRAFGCLLELPAPDGRRTSAYVTDPAWLADRLTQRIAVHVT